MSIEFEAECMHAAEMIIGGLLDGSERFSFYIKDMDWESLESLFMESVARFVGGLVVNGSIVFCGRAVCLCCDCSVDIDGLSYLVVFCDMCLLPFPYRRFHLPCVKLPLRRV
jgi:hypothetical protein